MIGVLVLALMLLAIGCILGAGAVRREGEREEARMLEALEREARLVNEQIDRLRAMKLDGSHLFKKPMYKPSAAYLAPAKKEEPKPTNVRQLRGAKR